MSWGAVIVAGGALLSNYMSNKSQRDSVHEAAASQERSAQAGIAEQHDEFAQIKKLLAPYTTAGTGALGAQQDLLGLNGGEAQQAAIDALSNSPQFAAMTKQGEDAILSAASATGGLRGGNVQATLAQFRPQILSQLINEQFNKLGGLTSLGENAAAMTGNAGIATGNSITDLLQQRGAAEAGAILAGGRASANNWGAFANTLGNLYAQGKLNFGSSSTTNDTPSNVYF